MLLAIVLVTVGSIALALAVTALIGASLPATHHVGSRIRLAAPAGTAWHAVSQLEQWPEWNPACRRMERGPDRDGRPFWRMASSFGELPILVVELTPPRRLVTRISPPSGSRLPFGGTWTYLVAPDGQGATVTIREDGEISNLVFRALARFLFGHHTTIDKTLLALARCFDQDEVAPEHLGADQND